MAFRNISLPMAQIEDMCDRRKITELALFGSALREDFQASSDIDILITFAPGARKGLMTLAQIKHELEDLLGREVDILTKKSLKNGQNSVRCRSILESAKVLYVA